MGDLLQLRGIRALGVHGVLPHELEAPQPFEVDLDLEVDLGPAGASDDLADTVDYGAVAAGAARLVEQERCALIERLAELIAGSVLAHGRVRAVTVTVRKLRPPVPVNLDHAAVRITRARSAG